jgi:transposase
MNNPTSQDVPLALLPSVPLRVEGVVIDENIVTLTARSLQASAACPLCQTPTSRLHSRYRRVLWDLPWGPLPVRLILKVRRFRCARRACPRRIFTERLPEVAAPYAHATTRFRQALREVGYALGGKPGAGLAGRLRLGASPSTVLRLVRATPALPPAVPRVVGVDDFAKRRGHSYGTIVVDLERRRPLALLHDRTAPTLAAWLKRHPTIEVVCSDRSTEYARGIAEGAPNAVAVADRWHLLKNLREAVERVVDGHAHALREITLPRPGPGSRAPSPTGEARALPPHRSARELARRQATREEREARFARVCELHAQGMSLRRIAAQVGLQRATVTRYVRADAFPERAGRRPAPGILAPFEDYLQRRWDEGCRNGLQLLREIQARGFPGSRKQLARWVQQRRDAPAPTTPTRYLQAREALPAAVRDGAPRPRRASARQLAWLLVRRPERLDEAERAALAQMQDLCPDLARAHTLAQSFGEMIRQRQADRFDAWLEAAETSGVGELKTFAAGLRRDERAVRGALTSEWSNGQTEGHVTRLKLAKRQGYGRAKLDLLERRLVGAG